ncbi:hypothetical protein HN587_00135 [Candidatus Woesearchaeota archaeon]|jgi:hypothetical protein|nr:hypothetical protein [Candidatus Woesearchaeota archaeon]
MGEDNEYMKTLLEARQQRLEFLLLNVGQIIPTEEELRTELGVCREVYFRLYGGENQAVQSLGEWRGCCYEGELKEFYD